MALCAECPLARELRLIQECAEMGRERSNEKTPAASTTGA